MHSSLDVIGGRVLATALSAAILNDPEHAELKQEAYEEGRALLLEGVERESIEQRIETYNTNKEVYAERLTYGFKQTGETGKEMVVPKGAEVLLETRFPYLDATERRYVLKTTGIDSGYVFLDDAEGWGRLNLYEAANGYGSFETDVTVHMDANLGGVNAQDIWMNDIDGQGQLTKQGTGELMLSGNNTFEGGTLVEGTNGTVIIDADYEQGEDGVYLVNGNK